MKYYGIEIRENLLGLSDDEVVILLSCVHMAAKEGFYDFRHINIENANENLINILQLCGLTPKEIEDIMDGNWFGFGID